MAIYTWSALSNGQQISFNPAVDKIVFDIPGVTWQELSNWDWISTPGGPAFILSYAGKQVSFVGLDIAQHAADTLTFASGTQLLVGDQLATTGADNLANLIVGGDTHDILYGLGGNDTINGGAGNDFINAGLGNDVIDGGAGFDHFIVSRSVNAPMLVNLLTGKAYIAGFVSTLTSIEAVRTGNDDDHVIGDAQDNLFRTLGGVDYVDGGAGFDFVRYLDPTVANGVTVNLSANFAAEDGFGSHDYLFNIEGVVGTNFGDNITGDTLANQLIGLAGNDTLTGLGANDLLDGGDSNDTLLGGEGNDTLLGGSGNDILRGDQGNDILDGGDGVDWAYYDTAGSAVTVNLALIGAQATGGAGSDTLISIENLLGSTFADRLTGNATNNLLRGGAGNDSLTGAAGNDNLQGDAGNDVLNGGAGNDIVNGGAGNDRLIGGAGKDQMTGGPGADIFVFSALSDSVGGANRDVITDFNRAQGDKINLTAVDANTSLAGNQSFNFIGTSAFSADATGQLRFDVATNTLFGSVNADATAEFSIKLNGVASVTATDLIL